MNMCILTINSQFCQVKHHSKHLKILESFSLWTNIVHLQSKFKKYASPIGIHIVLAVNLKPICPFKTSVHSILLAFALSKIIL